MGNLLTRDGRGRQGEGKERNGGEGGGGTVVCMEMVRWAEMDGCMGGWVDGWMDRDMYRVEVYV